MDQTEHTALFIDESGIPPVPKTGEPQIYVSGSLEEAEQHKQGDGCPEFAHIQRVRQFITGHFFMTHKELPLAEQDAGFEFVCPKCEQTTFYYRKPHFDYKLPLCLGQACLKEDIAGVMSAVGTDYLVSESSEEEEEGGNKDDDDEIVDLEDEQL